MSAIETRAGLSVARRVAVESASADIATRVVHAEHLSEAASASLAIEGTLDLLGALASHAAGVARALAESECLTRGKTKRAERELPRGFEALRDAVAAVNEALERAEALRAVAR